MKAYMKAFLLQFFKSGTWLMILLFAGLILWQPLITRQPVFCALAVAWLLVPVGEWQSTRAKSGFSVYESFSPVSAQQMIAGEYLLGFVLCMLFTVLMRFGSPWISRLLTLFPLLPLLFAAVQQPWFYLDKSRKVRIFVTITALLLAYFLFAQLREVPLVIPSYPLWMIGGINLLILLFYILSGLLAVYFARKRGGLI